jgi:hypothetical protein
MQTRNAFGEGSSPVVFDDTLVVNWDHEGDFVVALDKKGAELWRPTDEPTRATPMWWRPGKPRCHQARTGAELRPPTGLLWEARADRQRHPVSVRWGVSDERLRGAPFRVRLADARSITARRPSSELHKDTPYVPSRPLRDASTSEVEPGS